MHTTPPNRIALRAMSSLAGALDLKPSSRPSDDIDMTATPQSDHASEDDADQDEAMSDLFGNDNDVEEQHRARSV